MKSPCAPNEVIVAPFRRPLPLLKVTYCPPNFKHPPSKLTSLRTPPSSASQCLPRLMVCRSRSNFTPRHFKRSRSNRCRRTPWFPRSLPLRLLECTTRRNISHSCTSIPVTAKTQSINWRNNRGRKRAKARGNSTFYRNQRLARYMKIDTAHLRSTKDSKQGQ